MHNSLQKDFGFIFFPSLRSLAYLHAFSETQNFPKKVLLLEGEIENQKIIAKEAESLGCNHFYDMNLDIMSWLHSHNIEFQTITAKKINDFALLEQLKKEHLEDWIFSGGGILRDPLFHLGKRFLHIHPGILPQYRGSTCFYYSYLQEKHVGASAFWMEPEIDAGSPLHTEKFQIKASENCPPWFFDHIVDPYIRAQVLKAILNKTNVSKTIHFSKLDESYYVIHSWLRELSIATLIKDSKNHPFSIVSLSEQHEESL